MYTDSVHFYLSQLLDGLENRKEVVLNYIVKTFNYVFVYPKGTLESMDSDNHDTKAITDVICCPLGGDGGKICDLFSQHFTQKIVKIDSDNTQIRPKNIVNEEEIVQILDSFHPKNETKKRSAHIGFWSCQSSKNCRKIRMRKNL